MNIIETKIDDLCNKYSNYTAPSFLSAVLLNKDYINDFCLTFLLDIDKSLFIKSDLNIDEYFNYWFNDSNISLEFTNKLKDILGEPIEIINFKDDSIIKELLAGPFGTTGYYFLEDIFFAIYKDFVYCFMIGNNE